MFKMKVESQLNLADRTLICGKPEFDTVPETVMIAGQPFAVIGISHGVKLPFVSLEIGKTKNRLVGEDVIQST